MQDAGSILAQQAARLLDEPDAWNGAVPTVEQLAARLGVSERHLRRIFEAQFGVSPLQYLQTRRLLTAKQLLADTRLPITQVALVSGFGSLRRFNAAFVQHYGLAPTRLRREGAQPAGEGLQVRLGYRPPYDTAAMLSFFGQRAIAGMERVAPDDTGGRLLRTLQVSVGGREHAGWIEAGFDLPRHQLVLRVSESLHEALPQVIRRTRAAFDLDGDPLAVNAVLQDAFPDGDGLRVPGAFSGCELAVRAVLGQQITVAAARTLAQRVVERFGQPIATRHAGLLRLFPTPEALAQAEGDPLGVLGIVRQRQAAIVALARAVQSGALSLHGGADVPATLAALKALPGIGDWTAQYIAMRALRWPDAFPAGDVALHKALGVQQERQPARAAEAASQAWKPWRSYAVIRAWARLATPAKAEAQRGAVIPAKAGTQREAVTPAKAGGGNDQGSVTPAKAGAQRNAPAALAKAEALDSRLRGNDKSFRGNDKSFRGNDEPFGGNVEPLRGSHERLRLR